jgi:hypothetical protein
MRTLQVGGSIIYRALLAATHIGEQQLREISRTHSDAGRPPTTRCSAAPPLPRSR